MVEIHAIRQQARLLEPILQYISIPLFSSHSY